MAGQNDNISQEYAAASASGVSCQNSLLPPGQCKLFVKMSGYWKLLVIWCS